MADTKITALPATAGLASTTLFPVVDDPAGTPATAKATIAALEAYLAIPAPTTDAGDLVTGTLPDGRFPATLPALDGSNLTAVAAATAATLATPRTINGVAFDGSANISITAAATGNIGINDQTGTTYTPVIGDLGKLIRMNNAAANTLTVPPNSSVAFAVGDTMMVEQVGAGATTIAAGAGVTINYPPHTTLVLNGQRSIVTLIKVATDTWEIAGALTSTEPVEQTVAISANDVAIDYSAGEDVKTTLGANISTFTVTNPPGSGTRGVILWKGIADGTGRTITWSVNGVTVKWDGGSAPTIPSTSGNEIWVQLVSYDGFTTAVTGLLIAAEIS